MSLLLLRELTNSTLYFKDKDLQCYQECKMKSQRLRQVDFQDKVDHHMKSSTKEDSTQKISSKV